MKRTPVSPETPLQRHVAKWLRDQLDGYDSIEDAYRDLEYGGCQSGIVGHLIYYTDTIKFYRKYRKEIDQMLADTCADTGLSPAELFGNNGSKWDSDDPLAREELNQNLLAWFGFEETARYLMNA